MKCENNRCQYRCPGDSSCEVVDNVVIGNDGRCQSFKKGFCHYLYYFTEIMGNSNFVCLQYFNDDMRYCIYYLMKILPISFAVDDIRDILILRNEATGELLGRSDILDMLREADSEILEDVISEFLTNGLPEIKYPEKKVEFQEYGWLSPTGKYIEAKWGDHEKSAKEIIIKNHWLDEYNEWMDCTHPSRLEINYRDFLSSVKGYALIHDPSNQGYIVSHLKPLTKKQKDFLYGYFTDMGMTARAERYLEE